MPTTWTVKVNRRIVYMGQRFADAVEAFNQPGAVLYRDGRRLDDPQPELDLTYVRSS